MSNYKISFSAESIEPTTEDIGFYLGDTLGDGYSVVDSKEQAIDRINNIMAYFAAQLSRLVESSKDGQWANWEEVIKGASSDYQKWSRLLKKAIALSLVLFSAPVFGQSFKMCSAGIRTQVQDTFVFARDSVSFDGVTIAAPADKEWQGECVAYFYSRDGISAKVLYCGETAILTADIDGCLYCIEMPIQ